MRIAAFLIWSKLLKQTIIATFTELILFQRVGPLPFAMELQEKGLLNDPEIHFGNADILAPLIKQMAYKEGIGAELSEGSFRLRNSMRIS